MPSVGEHQAGASPGPAHQFCSAPEDSTPDPRCLPSCGTITLNPDPPACLGPTERGLVFFHGCFFGGSWMSALLRDRDHFCVWGERCWDKEGIPASNLDKIQPTLRGVGNVFPNSPDVTSAGGSSPA